VTRGGRALDPALDRVDQVRPQLGGRHHAVDRPDLDRALDAVDGVKLGGGAQLLGADLRPRRAQLVVQHLALDALGRRDPLVIAGTQVPSRASTTAIV
jgi:hypothetical protein